MVESLPATVIDEDELYCVVTDVKHREYAIISGRLVATSALIPRFSPAEVPAGFAPVELKKSAFVGIWCDPTKPKLYWHRELPAKEATPLVAKREEKAEPPVDQLNIAGIALAAAGVAARKAVELR